VGTTKNLNKVQFIDANNGWAVGDSGTQLLKQQMRVQRGWIKLAGQHIIYWLVCLRT